jgi:uncharacterized protein
MRKKKKPYRLSNPRDVIRDIMMSCVDVIHYRVFLFGSRARGDEHARSDRDIGILGEKPLSRAMRREIVAACEETPYRIDLVDFTGKTGEFHRAALETAETL